MQPLHERHHRDMTTITFAGWLSCLETRRNVGVICCLSRTLRRLLREETDSIPHDSACTSSGKCYCLSHSNLIAS